MNDFERLTVEPFTGGIDPAVPLISQIDENLWQGGWPGYIVRRLPPPFRFVMNIYGHGDAYETDAGVTMVIRRWHDAAFVPDDLEETAALINEWRTQGPTLVHCEGGWNRSGLAVGLALIRSGMTPDTAIALLREKRSPRVLFNSFFEQWLRSDRLST